MVLIVDDNVEEKLGVFKDEMRKRNFEVIIATNLEEAQEIFDKSSNEIDTIILDYYFPEKEIKDGDEKENKFCCEDRMPNGIKFLQKNCFKIKTKLIPIIINTASDDDIRKYWLEKVDISDITLVECTENRLLSGIANTGGSRLNEYLEFIEEGRRRREILKNNTAVKKTNRNAGPFIKDSKGNIIGYRDY